MGNGAGETPRSITARRAAFRGCLLGGAVGDALGAPVEFWSLAQIRDRFGPAGVTDLVAGDWPAGSITDDTQMTLFTAEGLIRALHRWKERGIASIETVAFYAYQRWLGTQGGTPKTPTANNGWLVGIPELHARRAPGNTCLAALERGTMGTAASPLNDSKGCGGVMRVAPVGLANERPFALGSALAALTHGHPSGYLAAGAFAEIVAGLTEGLDLRSSILRSLGTLAEANGGEETANAIRAAVARAEGSRGSAKGVEALGEGWVAEEALAIGLYCALVAEDFTSGVLLAVNHGGDSDSTGSIAGNLLGLIHGEAGIPKGWSGSSSARRSVRSRMTFGATSVPSRPVRVTTWSGIRRGRATLLRRYAPHLTQLNPRTYTSPTSVTVYPAPVRIRR